MLRLLKLVHFVGLQGRAGALPGLYSELGQPDGGEGGSVPQRYSGGSLLPAQLEDRTPGSQSKYTLLRDKPYFTPFS